MPNVILVARTMHHADMLRKELGMMPARIKLCATENPPPFRALPWGSLFIVGETAQQGMYYPDWREVMLKPSHSFQRVDISLDRLLGIDREKRISYPTTPVPFTTKAPCDTCG